MTSSGWKSRNERAAESRARIDKWRADHEKSCANYPDHLKRAETWTTWSDVAFDAEYFINQVRRRAEEAIESARRHDGHGCPNMAAADRFFAIVWRLAADHLAKENHPCRDDDDDEPRTDEQSEPA